MFKLSKFILSTYVRNFVSFFILSLSFVVFSFYYFNILNFFYLLLLFVLFFSSFLLFILLKRNDLDSFEDYNFYNKKEILVMFFHVFVVSYFVFEFFSYSVLAVIFFLLSSLYWVYRLIVSKVDHDFDLFYGNDSYSYIWKNSLFYLEENLESISNGNVYRTIPRFLLLTLLFSIISKVEDQDVFSEISWNYFFISARSIYIILISVFKGFSVKRYESMFNSYWNEIKDLSKYRVCHDCNERKHIESFIRVVSESGEHIGFGCKECYQGSSYSNNNDYGSSFDPSKDYFYDEGSNKKSEVGGEENSSKENEEDLREFYDVLGIEKSSTEDEMIEAYRELVKEHHPDKGGDKEKFKKIQEAKEELEDKVF